MYTKVDKDTCIACGSCSAEAPDVFAEDDNGIAYSTLDNNEGKTAVPEEFAEDVKFAQESCPTESVQVSDNEF